MDWRGHLRTTQQALKHWFVALCYDAVCVGAIWLVGLLVIKVPLAPLWAVLAGLLQFIPTFGPMISLIGPSLAAAVSSDHMRFFYVLILFAIVMVVDGFVLQPFLMKRVAKVPFFVSLIAPIVLGIIIPFWGVLLAPPVLAVVYAFRRRNHLLESPPGR